MKDNSYLKNITNLENGWKGDIPAATTPETVIEVRSGDVVCHRYDRQFYFSLVLSVDDDGGIEVALDESNCLGMKPITIKRDTVESVYREVFF